MSDYLFGCSDEHIPAEFEDEDALIEITDDYLDELHPPALTDEDLEFYYDHDDNDLLSELN